MGYPTHIKIHMGYTQHTMFIVMDYTKHVKIHIIPGLHIPHNVHHGLHLTCIHIFGPQNHPSCVGCPCRLSPRLSFGMVSHTNEKQTSYSLDIVMKCRCCVVTIQDGPRHQYCYSMNNITTVHFNCLMTMNHPNSTSLYISPLCLLLFVRLEVT